jgi:hypothetical protein
VVPERSRSSVQHDTWAGLTSGFGMGPGVSPPLWPLLPCVVLSKILWIFSSGSGPDGRLPESQGPDLNRSVVDLQSTASPLRHLGNYVCVCISVVRTRISSGHQRSYTLANWTLVPAD